MNDTGDVATAVADDRQSIAENALPLLSEPSLDPLFWHAERLGQPSSWWLHVPFAHWIVCTARPRLLVELGTHAGVSYSAFCQAVRRARLPTRCHAVDTWRGDDHAGAYDETVFQEFRAYHDEQFSTFSTLIRSTFDEAVDCIEDHSIDLLHIDGFHTYEAVRHDFETWQPKLSDAAVVLFHDVNERSRDFGVWRLWDELCGLYPSFTFLHGYGLGVLAVGSRVPQGVLDLCGIGEADRIAITRERFARLGERWLSDTRERMSGHRIGVVTAERDQARAQLATTHEAYQAHAIERDQLRDAAQAQARLREDSAQHAEAARAQALALQEDLRRAECEVVRLDGELGEARAQISRGEASVAEIAALRTQHAEATVAEVAAVRAQHDEALRERDEARAAHEQIAVQVEDLRALLRSESEAQARLRDQSAQRAATARAQVFALQEELRRAQAEVRRAHDVVAGVRHDLRVADSEVARLHDELGGARAQIHRAALSVAEIAADRDALRHLHARTVASTFWRATWPLRNAADRVPTSLRGALRGGFKLAWWTATLRLPSKLRDRQARIAQFAADAAAPQAPMPVLAIDPPTPAIASLPSPAIQPPARAGLSRLVYVSGEPGTPGHVYRIERYIDAAAGTRARTIRVDEIPGALAEIEAATALVLWRTPWCDEIAAAIAAARRGGARIVFDVDDLMIDPTLARTEVIDGIRSQFLTEDMVRDHYARVRQTMDASDVCFTTTEELAFHLRWNSKTTYVLPNGFDQDTHDRSRRAARRWRKARADGLVRIGYAGGSRTHQRDFGLAVEAIARLLRENPACRLVLFRTPDETTPLIDVEEFPALAGLDDRIEWRPLQPLKTLPDELARFDVNIAPLEFDNLFCEAKSELKFFEAALVDVPTVASPTGPFQRAIEHGKTGFLAASADEWYDALRRLVDDPALRARTARAAYHAALAAYGPMQRALRFRRVLAQLHGGAAGADAFALDAYRSSQPWAAPRVYGSDVIFEHDGGGGGGGGARVAVMVPLYNYETYIVEALDSVRDQTLAALDLVVVDGCSTDNSLSVASDWAERNAARFNRVLVLKNWSNYGLGFCRNSGFDAATTQYVLPLDADNMLLPECCERLLYAIEQAGTAFVYPTIQHFGASSQLLSNAPWDPHHLVAGNYIDAMALVSKEAWAIVGGYDHVRHGWEDFDFWCRMAEHGLSGSWHQETLALYRVHEVSMMRMQTLAGRNFKRLVENFRTRHRWVSLVDHFRLREMPKSNPRLSDEATRSRLDALLPVLRCPDTGTRLAWNADRTALLNTDGTRSWPVNQGRPVLAAHLADPPVHPDSHISNELPEEALALIRGTHGPVLNLSAGGSREKFAHVVEVEYAIFRHTDIVADAHVLPFYDETFDAVVVMNAFEHYREPHKVAAELRRVLKPGGQILIRTAFMQPLHERPWHFFNCTRYGLAEWFKAFETERLHVSANFCPNHSIAWLASEAETGLRADVSADAAEAFKAETVGKLVELWRDPSRRGVPLWTDFEKLSQTNQEITAAGFEFLGRKPLELPDLTGARPV